MYNGLYQILFIVEDIFFVCLSVIMLYIRNRCYWVLNEIFIFEDLYVVCCQNGGGLVEIFNWLVEDLVIKKFGQVFFLK